MAEFKMFFDVCRKGLYFESPKGRVTAYDLFQMSLDDLKEIYLDLKEKVAKDDPFLKDFVTASSHDEIRFGVVKEVILYKKEQARKARLLQKKKQLQKMLEQAKLESLKSDPVKLEEELAKLEAEIEDE